MCRRWIQLLLTVNCYMLGWQNNVKGTTSVEQKRKDKFSLEFGAKREKLATIWPNNLCCWLFFLFLLKWQKGQCHKSIILFIQKICSANKIKLIGLCCCNLCSKINEKQHKSIFDQSDEGRRSKITIVMSRESCLLWYYFIFVYYSCHFLIQLDVIRVSAMKW